MTFFLRMLYHYDNVGIDGSLIHGNLLTMLALKCLILSVVICRSLRKFKKMDKTCFVFYLMSYVCCQASIISYQNRTKHMST